ncbi:MAG: glycosyltransferase [Bryobacteraceae bacterium]
MKTAEDECTARLKVAAESIGVECIEVDSFARLLYPPHTQLTQQDVDFVLSLHYETPKRYDIFSFVALWNPLEFFYDWGYRRHANHLVTHDDFISCASTGADNHVKRLIATDPMREGPCFRLSHSLSKPVYEPTIGDQKLFYIGINWERVTKKPARFRDLLLLLDKTGQIRIHGPKQFLGVDVWEGYQSYVGPLPFDGVSVVREIHRAGISLVLSSIAHKESELMSSRLFESLAAGAVIICDENPFARRFFGDTLLYIDSSLPAGDAYAQVMGHVAWIKANPGEALDMARRSQEIFREEFMLDKQLQAIYSGLPARKEKLESLYKPASRDAITLLFLMPTFDPGVLERHIESYLAQKNVTVRPVFAMDSHDFELFRDKIEDCLNRLGVPYEVLCLKFVDRYPNGTMKQRRRLGAVISEALEQMEGLAYLCIAAPNEQLFSDHLCSLLRVLEDNESAVAATSYLLYRHQSDGTQFADQNDDADFYRWSSNRPIGFGRCLLRASAFRPDLGVALPYVDSLLLPLLVGAGRVVRSKRCTLILDIQDKFNIERSNVTAVDRERDVLADYLPEVFGHSPSERGVSVKQNGQPVHLAPASLSLQGMDSASRERLVVELAHSVPVPSSLKKFGFGLYRVWLKSRAR